jgi:alcohol dehydrogenase
MKAIIYGHRHVEEAQLPLPFNERNHVLVKVHAVGLNPVDAKDVLGDKLPHSWSKTREFIKTHFVENHVIGFDFSGDVVASSVSEYQPGDAVFGTMPPRQGSCAQYISAPTDQISKKPSVLSYEEAASLPLVGLTALQDCSRTTSLTPF